MTGFIVPTSDERFVVGLQEGLFFWSPETPDLVALPDAASDGEGHRFTEARCDARGRLWVGTMDAQRRGPRGSLYRYVTGEGLRALRRELMVPNSFAFFDGGQRMLFSNSTSGLVEVYEYDVETGAIANPRPFLTPDAAPGLPDGVAVDEDGCLWMARFGGGCVLRLSPEGRIIGRIDLPTTNVTSCAFGGVDLKTLFITTATALLSDAERAAQPMAGALFAVRPGVGGVPEARMAV